MTSQEQALIDKAEADMPAADAAVVRLEALLKAGDLTYQVTDELPGRT